MAVTELIYFAIQWQIIVVIFSGTQPRLEGMLCDTQVAIRAFNFNLLSVAHELRISKFSLTSEIDHWRSYTSAFELSSVHNTGFL